MVHVVATVVYFPHCGAFAVALGSLWDRHYFVTTIEFCYNRSAVCSRDAPRWDRGRDLDSDFYGETLSQDHITAAHVECQNAQ